MIFHFTVFLFSLVFFFFLSWVSRIEVTPSWGWYLATTLPLIVLSIVAARRLARRLVAAALPGVVSFSVPLLLSLIDTTWQQQVFVAAASFMYYAALLAIYRLDSAPEDQTARAMQNLAALASLFFVYAAAYGLYLNFEIPLWLLMSVYFFATALIAFQTLLGVARDQKRLVLFAGIILGIIFGELVWLLHFWPFGYLTVGMMTLLFFYWLWKAAFDLLRRTFSQQQFLFESLVIMALMLLLLLSSPWRMVV